MDTVVGHLQPSRQLGVEVGRRGEPSPRQEAALQIAVGSHHQPLASGSPGRPPPLPFPGCRGTAGRDRSRWACRRGGIPGPPRCHRPLCGGPHQDHEGSEDGRQDVMCLSGGDHLGDDHPGIARDPHQHRRLGRGAVLEQNRGWREPQTPLRQLPGRYPVRPEGSGGKKTGRSSRTRSFRMVMPLLQPIRSAITVAGILGCSDKSRRISPQTDQPPKDGVDV